MAARNFGLARLLDDANNRPPHRPLIVRAHVAQEYADLAAHAPDANAGYKVIAEELRRQHRPRREA